MKKIKFALEMEDGVKVRDLEQLRENFSIIKIYEHYQSGKLQSWLESRYYDEVLKAVQEIQCDEQSFYEKMCEILDTEIIESEQNVWKDFWMQMNRKKTKGIISTYCSKKNKVVR